MGVHKQGYSQACVLMEFTFPIKFQVFLVFFFNMNE